MSAGALIAAKQNRFMRRFEDALALDAASARTLAEIGCRESFVFNGLVNRGVIVEAADGRYYLDVEVAKAFRSRRRTVALVALVVGVVAMLFFVVLR